MESPSSLSFELHDFAALAREANQRGAVVIADNTYGPTLLRPLDLGANVSLNAATKYIGGFFSARLCQSLCATPACCCIRILRCTPRRRRALCLSLLHITLA
jgi:cysteine-S-conjugate beta-lyase